MILFPYGCQNALEWADVWVVRIAPEFCTTRFYLKISAKMDIQSDSESVH